MVQARRPAVSGPQQGHCRIAASGNPMSHDENDRKDYCILKLMESTRGCPTGLLAELRAVCRQFAVNRLELFGSAAKPS